MKAHRCRVGLIIGLIGYVLWMPGTSWAQQPMSGGTLQVAWEADVTGLDPHISPGLQAYRVVANLF
ncbi:MAG TPA: hypothetical protein VLK82_06815, partial [Candidatus Tectomicrobia bacterium]|nr:hypothetical protein [Candidatus Tectomicrobia bacterium]